MSYREVDNLIIGGGMAGTAAAFGLSQQKRSCLLVEAGSSLAPARSSSSGDSRMYRRLYSDVFFSQMQEKALKRWKELESLTGQRLLHANGLLFYGDGTEDTVEGSIEGAKQTMEALKLPHTYFASGFDIALSFPALRSCREKSNYHGIFEETAGFVRARQACRSMVEAAGKYCQVQLNTQIVSLHITRNNQMSKDSIVTAVTEHGETIVAKHCILAAGAWTNQLLDLAGLDRLRLKIWKMQWGHYEIKDPQMAKSIPQAYYFGRPSPTNGQDGGLYYVFPSHATESFPSENEKFYVKVGTDFPTGMSMDDMDKFDYTNSETVLQLMDRWVEEHLPGAGKRVHAATSPYTMTEDSYFVMDNLPGCNNSITVFAGGCGRAFKFAPLIGDCLASLCAGMEPPLDLQRFSAKRDCLRLV